MAIKRPKVNLEFSVPRPKPKGIGDASPMAGAAKTVIPGAGGVARWTVGDEKPFTQEQLFSNDPYGTDPRDAATQRQSSVTMPQATIDAVQARRAMEANRQAGVNANIGMLGAFGAGATQGATGLGKTFEGVAGATGASQGGVPRPSVPQGVGGNIGPAAAARPALQADAGEGVPRPDADINPTGRPMSTLEAFNRRKIVNNPNAYSPAERQKVQGDIAREQGEAVKTQGIEQQKAQAEAKAQAEIEGFREQERIKTDAAIKIAGAEAGFTETAAGAEAVRGETRAKADAIRKGQEITAQSMADRAKTDAEMLAKGEKVGSPPWIQRKGQEIQTMARELVLTAQLDEITAKRDATVSVVGSMFQSPIPPNADTVKLASDALADAFGQDVPADMQELLKKFGGGTQAQQPPAPAQQTPATQPTQASAVDFDGNPRVQSPAEKDYTKVTTRLQSLDPKNPAHAYEIRELKDMQTVIWNSQKPQDGVEQGRTRTVQSPVAPPQQQSGAPWDTTRFGGDDGGGYNITGGEGNPTLVAPDLGYTPRGGSNAPQFRG